MWLGVVLVWRIQSSVEIHEATKGLLRVSRLGETGFVGEVGQGWGRGGVGGWGGCGGVAWGGLYSAKR